jgi:hypothetical protein
MSNRKKKYKTITRSNQILAFFIIYLKKLGDEQKSREENLF